MINIVSSRIISNQGAVFKIDLIKDFFSTNIYNALVSIGFDIGYDKLLSKYLNKLNSDDQKEVLDSNISYKIKYLFLVGSYEDARKCLKMVSNEEIKILLKDLWAIDISNGKHSGRIWQYNNIEETLLYNFFPFDEEDYGMLLKMYNNRGVLGKSSSKILSLGISNMAKYAFFVASYTYINKLFSKLDSHDRYELVSELERIIEIDKGENAGRYRICDAIGCKR